VVSADPNLGIFAVTMTSGAHGTKPTSWDVCYSDAIGVTADIEQAALGNIYL